MNSYFFTADQIVTNSKSNKKNFCLFRYAIWWLYWKSFRVLKSILSPKKHLR